VGWAHVPDLGWGRRPKLHGMQGVNHGLWVDEEAIEYSQRSKPDPGRAHPVGSPRLTRWREGSWMVLREFLYVDTDKVRSMLAQIEGGIAEEARETERRDKRTEAGVKGVGLHQQSWGSEST
jgi:hypothetical protein